MALVRKENVTLATLELPQALQLARHFANALDLDFEEVLRKPEEALLRYQDLYPNAGRLKIRYFDGDSATMKHIKEWREDLKQEYGEDFRGNFIDYLNLLAPSKGNYDGDTKRLDLVSRELCEYGKSEMCWNYTASAPTRDNDKIEIKDASGKFKLPTNGGVGGAYAISKNVDNNVWLVRVAASEFDLENYDIYAVGTKDRLGASRKSMWISEPFKPNFINSRIDINTIHSAHMMVKREEVDQL